MKVFDRYIRVERPLMNIIITRGFSRAGKNTKSRISSENVKNVISSKIQSATLKIKYFYISPVVAIIIACVIISECIGSKEQNTRSAFTKTADAYEALSSFDGYLEVLVRQT